MALTSPRYPPLGEHRAHVREYLREIALPFESVAGTIVREQLAAEREAALLDPSLALWACAACGGPVPAAVPIAAAVALFESSMRLHDESAEARAPAHWGLGQSLNAGDALYAVAFRTLAENVVDPPRRLAAARTLARAVLEAIEGRLGAMQSGALAAGAIVAGAPVARVRALARTGRLLAGIERTRGTQRAARIGQRAISAIERCGIDAPHRAAFEELVAYLLDQA
jgi:geranylgeranyl pyrophosphate synthase